MSEEYPPVDLGYQKDLEVDQHNLELEWVRQAGLMDKYSVIHAQAIFDRNRAEDRVKDAEANLKKVFAELDGEARGPVLPEGLAKQVDAAVKEWIIRHKLYQEAQWVLAEARKKLAEAQYVVDVMFGAVMAFQAKKVALENLVRLFGMKYYAEPYDQAGSDMRPQAMERGRLAATEAMRKTMGGLPEADKIPPAPPCKSPADGNTPKPSVTLGPPVGKPPAPGLAPTRDKHGHRYAIGTIVEDGHGLFSAGPWPELQQALDRPGQPGQGIYRLTREQPDELMYVWTSREWVIAEDFEAKKITSESKGQPDQPPLQVIPKGTPLPPRPPQRPLPKAR